MSLRTANLLTIGGFCTLYFGLMGILMAINVPVSSDARKPALLTRTQAAAPPAGASGTPAAG